MSWLVIVRVFFFIACMVALFVFVLQHFMQPKEDEEKKSYKFTILLLVTILAAIVNMFTIWIKIFFISVGAWICYTLLILMQIILYKDWMIAVSGILAVIFGAIYLILFFNEEPSEEARMETFHDDWAPVPFGPKGDFVRVEPKKEPTNKRRKRRTRV